MEILPQSMFGRDAVLVLLVFLLGDNVSVLLALVGRASGMSLVLLVGIFSSSSKASSNPLALLHRICRRDFSLAFAIRICRPCISTPCI